MNIGMTSAAELVHEVLTNKKMWDQDLTGIEGLERKRSQRILRKYAGKEQRLLMQAACKCL